MTQTTEQAKEKTEEQPVHEISPELKLVHVMTDYLLDDDDTRANLQRWMCERSDCAGDCNPKETDKAIIILLANLQFSMVMLATIMTQLSQGGA